MEVVVEDKQLSPRHRQEGPERPPGGQARGLAHRHQERGREAPGGRGRDGAHGARSWTSSAASSRHGVGEKTVQKLDRRRGARASRHLLEMTDERARDASRASGPKTAEKIREAAAQAKVEWDERDAEEAERLAAEQAQAEQAAAAGRGAGGRRSRRPRSRPPPRAGGGGRGRRTAAPPRREARAAPRRRAGGRSGEGG